MCRTAWVLRFVHNARRSDDCRKDPFTSEEYCQAPHLWIKEAQTRAYGAEIKALISGAHLSRESPLLKLRPKLDDEDLLCAVPRTNELPLPILPEFAYITALVIDDAHRRYFHQGTRSRTILAVLSRLILTGVRPSGLRPNTGPNGPGTIVSPSGTDRKLLNGPGSDVN